MASSKKKPLPTQADGLRSVRAAHSQEVTQDYVEAIADLLTDRGEARVTDLAALLGVSHVTVSRTVGRLQQSWYVTAEPYRSIFLTETGQKLAMESKHRHEIVVQFLLSIGVPEDAAVMDAEGIEHHVSPDTLAALKRFLARCKNKRR